MDGTNNGGYIVKANATAEIGAGSATAGNNPRFGRLVSDHVEAAIEIFDGLARDRRKIAFVFPILSVTTKAVLISKRGALIALIIVLAPCVVFS